MGALVHLETTFGVAGDMLLGALVDVGVPLPDLQAAVDAVLPATVELRASEVLRCGLRATKVDVDLLVPDQPHRRWREIDGLIAGSELADRPREWARQTFRALARAEGRVHGIDPEDVHFHEVGAWDSVADVVGVCAGLDLLDPARMTVGAVALGDGTVRAAHGRLPVPGPAVLELVTGRAVVTGPGGTGELATPTGVALTLLAEQVDSLPPVVVARTGVGAGTKTFDGHPNVVRVVVGADAAAATGAQVQERVVVEATVDDLDPRLWPGVVDALLAAGADDAWLTPVLMKKGRPGHVVAALCSPPVAGEVRRVLFATTTTLGVREHAVTRQVLDRCWRTVTVGGCDVRVKLGVDDGRIVNAQPEFADVHAAARDLGLAEVDVLQQALAAGATAGLVAGGVVPPA